MVVERESGRGNVLDAVLKDGWAQLPQDRRGMVYQLATAA